MNPDAVATAFVEHYYSTFDSNRAGLANLYQENSMLSFEGVKIQGAQHIVAKLTSLPFQQCKHQINTVDCQPSGPIGGMLVFVSGNLQLPGEEHVLKFSQSTMACQLEELVERVGVDARRKLSPLMSPMTSKGGSLMSPMTSRGDVSFDANTTREFLCDE